MIKIISAVSSNGVIGIDNKLPFYYPEDLKHFKQCTINSTVIMGRKTFESIGKPLPNRKNIVITTSNHFLDRYPNSVITVYSNLQYAIESEVGQGNNNLWLIGGASIYQEGMKYAEEIHLTITPDVIDSNQSGIVSFPWINPLKFSTFSSRNLSEDSKLKYFVYKKI